MAFQPALFASTFAIIFFAELPDKTALAALVLATRHRPAPVFLGTAAALAVQSVIAVVAGGLLALLPPRPVHVGSALVFLISAAVMWFRKEEEEDVDVKVEPSFWREAGNVFVVVFIAEWGDLTQIGTAALATRPGATLTVFIGAICALWAVAAIAVVAGHRAKHWLSPRLAQGVGALLFLAAGVLMLVAEFTGLQLF